jgi:hypothetical protein
MLVTPEGAVKPNTQLGIFDKHILCAKCDGDLGKFDDYAVQVCRDYPTRAIEDRGKSLWAMPGVDGNTFAKFILAVLWRASISQRPEVTGLKLGPFDDDARDVLFGLKPLADLPAFELILARYDSDWIKSELFYSIPVHTRFGRYGGYGFALCGFRVFAKFDSQRLPAQWGPYIVNGNDTLRGTFKQFDETDEFGLVVQALNATATKKK